MTHSWIDTRDARGTVTARGSQDADRTGAERFTVYTISFQILNDADVAASVSPQVELAAGTSWRPIPEVDPVDGIAFYAASDDGRSFTPRRAAIAVGQLRSRASEDPRAVAVAGVSSFGVNPLPVLELAPHAFTEVEFAVRATVDARWQSSYEFRLTSDRAALAAARQTRIVMGAKPALVLSPGQRGGQSTSDPLPLYPLDGNAFAQTWADLAASTTPAAPTTFASPHRSYGLTSDTCAACHMAHQGQSAYLLAEPEPQSSLCFRCHDGTGAIANVEADFTSPSLPANDPTNGSWFSHPATAAAPTTTSGDPFGGVLNRRSLCTDCHQPHLADGARPGMTTAGWTAGGAIGGATGVGVTNGAAGTAPTYTLKGTVTLEYELCFKCHSGYTIQPAADPAHPSRWALDKGVELNPANVSYHPVEAAGKNQTRAMAASLAGTSPAKLWSLDPTSTVRCQHCHGDSDVANPASPPSADAVLDNHAGPNRGLLIAPYRDRALLGTLETYDPADFSLCYVCHAEAPMVDGTGDARTDTNFNWHGLHLNEIWLNGTGSLDIDVPGAGQGNAVCAECHFRIHGTALAVGGQTPAPGLLNFAPDVQPLNGVLQFKPWTAGTPGSCTLTCHGRPHAGFRYEGVP